MKRLQRRERHGSLLSTYSQTLGELMTQRHSEEAMRAGMDEKGLSSRTESSFLATMGHELRAPLNAIIGFSDFIKAGNGDISAHVEYAAHISEAGRRMLHVVSDMLDMAKLESGTLALSLQPCSLHDVINDAINAIQKDLVTKSQTLDVRIAGDLPLFSIDYRRIKQILTNLLSNAIKFTLDGGRIALAAEHSPEGGALIAISDAGSGMSSEHINLALGPFTRARSHLLRICEGAGLGLPIALGLARLHGGDLRLESTPGSGTRAILILSPSSVVS